MTTLRNVAAIIATGRVSLDRERTFEQTIAARGPFRTETLGLARTIGAVVGVLVGLRIMIHPWAYPSTPGAALLFLLHMVGGFIAATGVTLGVIASTLWWSSPSRRFLYAAAVLMAAIVVGELLPVSIGGELNAPMSAVEVNPAGWMWRPSWLPAHTAWPELVKDSAWYMAEVLLVVVGWTTHRILLPRWRALATLSAGLAFFALTLASVSAYAHHWAREYIAPGTPGWVLRATWSATNFVGMLFIALFAWVRIVADRGAVSSAADKTFPVAALEECFEAEAKWRADWRGGAQTVEHFYRRRADACSQCEKMWLREHAGRSTLHERLHDAWVEVNALDSDGEGAFAWEEENHDE